MVDTFLPGAEDVPMPKSRPPYPPEFRERVLELQRLRRENRRLKMEREILEQAAAWFARVGGLDPLLVDRAAMRS